MNTCMSCGKELQLTNEVLYCTECFDRISELKNKQTCINLSHKAIYEFYGKAKFMPAWLKDACIAKGLNFEEEEFLHLVETIETRERRKD